LLELCCLACILQAVKVEAQSQYCTLVLRVQLPYFQCLVFTFDTGIFLQKSSVTKLYGFRPTKFFYGCKP